MERLDNHIIVKDYPWKGNVTFGSFYEIHEGQNFYLLDDGDIYSESMLRDEEYEFIKISSEEIIEKFKERFQDA